VSCYIWYSKEGTGRGRSPPRPLLAVPNVTADLSTAGVPITVFLYNGPLLRGFNLSIKVLTTPAIGLLELCVVFHSGWVNVGFCLFSIRYV